MTTDRALRAEKRTAAKALGGSVLTNKVRFTQLQTSEQMPTPALRELMYTKNRLQHQVENLQDLANAQAAKIKDLTDEVDEYKTFTESAKIKYLTDEVNEYKTLLRTAYAKKDIDMAEKDQAIATLKDVIEKQSASHLAEHVKVTEQQKALYRAVNTAGKVLAMASRTHRTGE